MRTKKHRLAKQNYIGKNIYFITIDLCDDYLKDEKLIYIVKDILDATVKKYDIANILTTFMYEHIHFIFQGQKEDSHLIKCLKSFKSFVSINADIKSAAAKRDKKF